MPYNPSLHHRRSIRLSGYDYSQAGLYFITICCQDRVCLFGEIINDKMILNDAGKIADEYLNDIPNHFSHVEMGEFIVMPNHVHCILKLRDVRTRHVMSANHDDGTSPNVGTRHVVSPPENPDTSVGTRHVVSLPDNTDTSVRTSHVMSLQHGTTISGESKQNQFSKPIPGSVSVIIQQYKSSVKRWANKNNHEHFQWQSRFHDHIIRDEQSYQTISNYIINNPAKWKDDKFYNK